MASELTSVTHENKLDVMDFNPIKNRTMGMIDNDEFFNFSVTILLVVFLVVGAIVWLYKKYKKIKILTPKHFS